METNIKEIKLCFKKQIGSDILMGEVSYDKANDYCDWLFLNYEDLELK